MFRRDRKDLIDKKYQLQGKDHITTRQESDVVIKPNV
jgi:hypothetical protein